MNSVISHRGIFDSQETSLDSIQKCIDNEIGLEIDLRLNKDSVYVSHDICEPSLYFEDVCSCLKKSNVQLALHVKELSVITPCLQILKKNNIKNFFLFTVENYKIQKDDNFEIAYYANTMPHDISNQIIWCDESIKKWFNSNSISELKNNNNQLLAISEEILTNCSLDDAKSYWKFLHSIGFNGICTDFAKDCKYFISKMGEKN